MSASFWQGRPGLAGGIDKDGSRAVALLSGGFGSVEFGTVTPQPEPGHNPGVAALVANLSSADRSKCHGARVGVSLGAGLDAAPFALAAEWLAGMHAAWAVADYLCFNLSARAYRPLLAVHHAMLVVDAVATVVRAREQLTRRTGRRVALALKLPLAEIGGHRPECLRAIAEIAPQAGLDALVAVLPASSERLALLREAVSLLQGGTAVIAVGGLRTADDVRAVLAVGAQGVQVHGAFVERGVDCLPALQAGMSVSDIPAAP